jgi:hypothetical protein
LSRYGKVFFLRPQMHAAVPGGARAKLAGWAGTRCCFPIQPQTHRAGPGKGEQGAQAGQGRRCTLSTSSSLSGAVQRSYRFPGPAPHLYKSW